MDLAQQVDQLLHSQLRDWKQASVNYNDLNRIRIKSFAFDDIKITLQFNPKRIVSSSAKVDARSIEARLCFLCSHNRPVEQQGISFMKDYIILVNPFPIFPKHLTIPSLQHRPQLIHENFEDMLHLAKALPDYVVFYNGPLCGASAPDHFHFQAGLKGLMPVEQDFLKTGYCILHDNRKGIQLYQWQHYLRNLITCRGNDIEAILRVFDDIYTYLVRVNPEGDEPMMNILTWFDRNEWIIHVYPRRIHRPAQYYEKGDRQIVLSPASVDLGGAFIIPREEDFEKITRDDVTDILGQVCMDSKSYGELLDYLKA